MRTLAEQLLRNAELACAELIALKARPQCSLSICLRWQGLQAFHR